MTLDEAIKHAEEVAEENQRVVDTGIVFDDVTIDEFYCDDTEVIAEHLVSCETCAEEHRQLAEWLKDYKRLLEQEPVLDKIKDEIETEYGQCDICEYFEDYDYEENDISEYRPIGNIADVLQIIDKYKAEMKGDKDGSK